MLARALDALGSRDSAIKLPVDSKAKIVGQAITLDAAGNLKTRTDSRGVVASYSYDAADNLRTSQVGSRSATHSYGANNLITGLTGRQIDDLFADGTISGGMLPKLAGAIDAAKSGVNAVHVVDGRVPHAMLLEILTEQAYGTMIRSH